MINSMDKEKYNLIMEILTQVNGKIIYKMVSVFKNFKTETNMRVFS
jgi:hypothetical protein